jgi:ABC-type microcin C transport system permease subunit YejE
MIKLLRKKHYQIWATLAVLLPAGIISAYIAVPKQAVGILLQQDKIEALPVVINKVEKNKYTVVLRSTDDKSNYQLQWINKKEFVLPSSLIYKISNTENELIGRIAGEGDYLFSLPKGSTDMYSFILYDIIHRQAIDSIKF